MQELSIPWQRRSGSGFGRGTRLLQYITDGDKSYAATIVLGASTVTDDVEGAVETTASLIEIARLRIRPLGKNLRNVGKIMQRPSSIHDKVDYGVYI